MENYNKLLNRKNIKLNYCVNSLKNVMITINIKTFLNNLIVVNHSYNALRNNFRGVARIGVS